MDLTTTLLFGASVLLGAVIHAVGGFGFGVFVMSVFPYFMPSYTTGLVVSGLMGITIAAYLAFRQFRLVKWRVVMAPFISSVAAGFLTTQYLKALPDVLLSRALGIFLVLLSVYFFVFEQKIHLRSSLITGVIIGGAAGMIDTLFGVGGVLLALYLSSVEDSKEAYVANLSCLIFLLCLGTSFNRIAAGMVTAEILKLYALGLVFVAAGMKIGGRIFTKFSPAMLKKAVYLFVAASGLLLVSRSFIA